jgi:tyrosyl-tRNA synthetase
LDITEKVDLIERPPTEEVVTHEELIELFKTNSSPKHYIGLEISGFLHLGSLISTGFKINDFVKAGVNCTIFLADWHTMINDKLGGDWDTITKVSKYYADAFKLVCPDANIVLGSDLYDSRKEYWKEFMKFTKHMSLKRTMRTLTIMGRSEDESKIDLAKLLLILQNYFILRCKQLIFILLIWILCMPEWIKEKFTCWSERFFQK